MNPPEMHPNPARAKSHPVASEVFEPETPDHMTFDEMREMPLSLALGFDVEA